MDNAERVRNHYLRKKLGIEIPRCSQCGAMLKSKTSRDIGLCSKCRMPETMKKFSAKQAEKRKKERHQTLPRCGVCGVFLRGRFKETGICCRCQKKLDKA